MTFQTILEFIAVLASLILIHEIGHFVVGRLFKIEVEEFGIGFPPRVMTLFESGRTKYSLNLLPLGGFVRFAGETDPSAPGSLASANPWVRIAVYFAGPLMNLLAAVILYAVIIGAIGMPDTTQVLVKDVAANSPAAIADLHIGDLILKINDQEIDSIETLQSVIGANLDQPIQITFRRGESKDEITLVPRSSPPPGEGAIGVIVGNPAQPINPIFALPAGVIATYEHSRALVSFAGQLIQGKINPGEGRLLGYKGMYDLYEQTRESEPVDGIPSIVNVLGYITSITISLGILNLLPIPALDGGRIMLTLPEIVLRRRIPPEYENLVNVIGFALLLLLLIYINLQDIVNPADIPR